MLHSAIQVDTHDSIEDARTALQLYEEHNRLEAEGTWEDVLEEVYQQGRQTVRAILLLLRFVSYANALPTLSLPAEFQGTVTPALGATVSDETGTTASCKWCIGPFALALAIWSRFCTSTENVYDARLRRIALQLTLLIPFFKGCLSLEQRYFSHVSLHLGMRSPPPTINPFEAPARSQFAPNLFAPPLNLLVLTVPADVTVRHRQDSQRRKLSH